MKMMGIEAQSESMCENVGLSIVRYLTNNEHINNSNQPAWRYLVRQKVAKLQIAFFFSGCVRR